jgi:adenylosuccinate lyase
MTAKQWEIATWWTLTLTSNAALAEEAKLNELHRFQRELEEKAKGDVDMATILWIWDQHAQLTPTGKEYQNFRQRMLDDMKQGQVR